MTMTVIDVGAFPHRHEVSVEPLIERFNPDRLFAFDPYPEQPVGVFQVGRTLVVSDRVAAWTRDGLTELAVVAGDRAWDSTVMTEKNTRGEWDGQVVGVGCFDLAAWIDRKLYGDRIVLKLDCEGAEYPLLEHLLETGVADRIELLLVEWHAHRMVGSDLVGRQARIVSRWPRAIEEWGA